MVKARDVVPPDLVLGDTREPDGIPRPVVDRDIDIQRHVPQDARQADLGEGSREREIAELERVRVEPGENIRGERAQPYATVLVDGVLRPRGEKLLR